MNIQRFRNHACWLKLTIITGFLLVAGASVKAQALPVKRQSSNYLHLLRNTSDSLLRLPVGKDVRQYYFQVTRTIYSEALTIAKAEVSQQSGTQNAVFARTIVQLITKLNGDLKALPDQQGAIPVSAFIQRNTNAALGNFGRYQQPEGLNHERQYLWVMIQVFENLNQINVGYLQAGLTPEEKKAVWQRLNVQQQITAQLRSKYEP
ncbi:hypothetical protein DIU31_031575 [Mucilaginibacter rubeus]|uniref:DUF4142 domain-containing protein n=1 Tax=Mucilaginibacter rubeus TaxID=2027860 RepID=A0AAE6MLJ5_9SPHI|nr:MULTISPECIES: hypothetical protein [Mucilaginibacter]QEM07821.1 hypothetical protein DIU31_031575 [Mucilaginibacter rubeus]QEM20273.1 hypothetical protein DIU38_031180 [Mucilaginibacter gossypii]QTE43009.1 hypothetical protein J3L19_29485 [Mucilaginibacter rubeus]QTE49610.1 hypothetical protein J3L21_29445 [Mucilaginibacter rubeus]QTE54705.1 hypothetical protein J3L23_21065 [Mucilaginibacter rubeus]